MKPTTMLALAALLCAPVLTTSNAAFAASDTNEPSATEATKTPPATHKKHLQGKKAKHVYRHLQRRAA